MVMQVLLFFPFPFYDPKFISLPVKGSDVNEGEEIGIVTLEKDPAFGDSDMSQEELRFLPASPCHDVPEQQDKFLESSSKLMDSNNSESTFSEETGANGHMMNHASSPVEGNVTPCDICL
jgi:COMPASS component SWD1